ncbi:MAG TPA: hypothetical protein HPQ04_07185 [Rhodospirillaceae bacterium]|nr:hypothetical protein [Rhodospirillaceae bacterium]
MPNVPTSGSPASAAGPAAASTQPAPSEGIANIQVAPDAVSTVTGSGQGNLIIGFPGNTLQAGPGNDILVVTSLSPPGATATPTTAGGTGGSASAGSQGASASSSGGTATATPAAPPPPPPAASTGATANAPSSGEATATPASEVTHLIAGAGHVVLVGGPEADVFTDGTGTAYMVGNGGGDTFQLGHGSDDVIVGFTPGTDHISLASGMNAALVLATAHEASAGAPTAAPAAAATTPTPAIPAAAATTPAPSAPAPSAPATSPPAAATEQHNTVINLPDGHSVIFLGLDPSTLHADSFLS